VMDKDRQGAAQKRQAVVRLVEARPKRQRGSAKAAAPGGGKPPLAAKSGAPTSGKAPEATAGAGGDDRRRGLKIDEGSTAGRQSAGGREGGPSAAVGKPAYHRLRHRY
jgi:hypothetical protein